MSWLINDLANKAEALLDKVDQTAASALKEEDRKQATFIPSENPIQQTSYGKQFINMEKKDSAFTPSAMTTPATSKLNKTFPIGQSEVSHNRVASLGSQPPPHHSPIPRVASVPSLKRKSAEDEKLFEFLNSSKATSTATNSPTTITMATRVSTGSSSNEKKETVIEPTRETPQNMLIQKSNPEPKSKAEEILKTAPAENRHSSQLELENKMLKTEIASLNEQVRDVFEKFKAAQKDNQRRSEMERSQQENVSSYQKMVMKLQDTERDQIEQLKAKDSQLAVLQVRLQEADALLQSKSSVLNRLQDDNERILNDHTASAGLQNVALDEMRLKFNEKEAELTQEKETVKKYQNENANLQQKLQNEQQSMAATLKSIQTKLNEEKGKHRDLIHSQKMAIEAAETAQRDLTEYKEKAGKILQAKERLIASLKDGSGGDAVSTIVASELDELKMERDALRTDQQQLRYRLDQIKLEWRDNDHQRQVESDEQMEQIKELESNLEEQQAINQKITNELEACKNEIQCIRQDHAGAKGSLQRQLMERETEIASLKQQILISSTSSSSQQELEGRIHSLTDTLIQKQTLVEALSTEKNSLFLQLERLERQYRSVQESLSKQMNLAQNERSGSRDQDSEEMGVSRSQTIASIMPTPVQRSNHVKTTLNTIDRFSVRFGRMLRQYPAARLFFIVYMFCLHLWVTVVLLTYQPEVHDSHAAMPKAPNR